MLKYKSRDTESGLQVRFTRATLLVSPIATAILLIAIRYFGVSIGHLADSSIGFEDALGALLGFALSGLAAFAAGFTLCYSLRRYRCLFLPTKIGLAVLYLGVPLKTFTFEQDEIHSFGWAHPPHGGSPVLRFAASGQRYVLASGVTENEANNFVKMLGTRGIVYSNKSEPLQRKTAANTLLG